LKAEARDDFESRARERRERAAQLRNAGWSYKEIADDMEISTGAVGALLHIARRDGLLINRAVKRAG
jgi:DNA-directed RNA polymerase specialized sigma24 family protein